ncbi:hypothetical protein MSNKSG1_13597 [Marinobacter santoriniensis NKSG1]|jgi:CDGSH-type Zn-finger protein|uniref:Iron-binding zinc finger CDGSH type domain-containing protein n=1 Tax=Marinobacter santoriniensis NKSG1 TaxID=1288826 RepID=M7CNM8_9GAMM|nr:CDGSH iron-sulfur domain-containing protein [Marinobacter santoriniensis]EMP54769.1 hypothetical protein MSNKSG1_13597 [Marinobacter santoriniensis NKSG1]
MSDEQPVIAKPSPYAIEVEGGRNYLWCACGRSDNQPFCDGSHKGTSFTPVKYTAEKTEWLWFCGCKRTGSSPLCDGTHKALD